MCLFHALCGAGGGHNAVCGGDTCSCGAQLCKCMTWDDVQVCVSVHEALCICVCVRACSARSGVCLCGSACVCLAQLVLMCAHGCMYACGTARGHTVVWV